MEGLRRVWRGSRATPKQKKLKNNSKNNFFKKINLLYRINSGGYFWSPSGALWEGLEGIKRSSKTKEIKK